MGELPSCLPMSVDKKSPEKAMLVWSPSFLDKSGVKASELDECEYIAINNFGYSREQALAMLFWHKCDLEKAKRDLAKFTPVPSAWSDFEKKLFNEAVKIRGKKFDAIKKMLPDKSVKELIEYYFSRERANKKPKKKQTEKMNSKQRVFSSFSPMPTCIIRADSSGQDKARYRIDKRRD